MCLTAVRGLSLNEQGRCSRLSAIYNYNSSACESANTVLTQKTYSACYEKLHMVHGDLSAVSIEAIGEFKVG